jgi:hypothetical protein
MPFQTNSRSTRRTSDRQPRDRNETPKTDPRRPWADAVDKNHNGRIDFDDLLIGLREVFQWVFSWRGATLLCGSFTVFAGIINVSSWTAATGSFAAGLLSWGVIQTLELMPALDSLNMRASIAGLVRLQRKPLEIPVVNHELNPVARKKFKRYRNREKSQEMTFEAIRWVCYALEFFVLIVGGGILSATGVSWSAVLLALVGMFGVEVGLRLTNTCGEKLLSTEEREFIRSLEASVRRTSVTVPDHNSQNN